MLILQVEEIDSVSIQFIIAFDFTWGESLTRRRMLRTRAIDYE